MKKMAIRPLRRRLIAGRQPPREMDVDRTPHALGDALAAFGGIDERCVARVGDIAGLEQDRGHVGCPQPRAAVLAR